MKISLQLFGGGSAASDKGSLGSESVTHWAQRMYRQRGEHRDALNDEKAGLREFIREGGIQGQGFIIVTTSGEILNISPGNYREVLGKLGRKPSEAISKIAYIQTRTRLVGGAIGVSDSLGFTTTAASAAREVAQDRSKLTTYTTTVTSMFSKALKK